MLNLPLDKAYLRRLVDRIASETGLNYIRMEMGVPGLPSPDAAIQGEIQAL